MSKYKYMHLPYLSLFPFISKILFPGFLLNSSELGSGTTMKKLLVGGMITLDDNTASLDCVHFLDQGFWKCDFIS